MLEVPTPWHKMTADEKTQLSLRLLDTMVRKTHPLEMSTTNPGPMPLDEMYLLARIMRRDDKSQG